MSGDGYAGPAELIDGATRIAIHVTHFDLISGPYHWYGRVAASPEAAALVESDPRTVVLRTPFDVVDTVVR